MGITRKMALFKVNLNWKWFNDYFDILKEIYKSGFFLIKDQQIVYWALSRKECYAEAHKKKLEQGHYSVQGFEDIENPPHIY